MKSINPSFTILANTGPDPVCTTAGPETTAILPPLSLTSFISDDIFPIMEDIGFSEDASLAMNSNTPFLPLGRSGGRTWIPSLPTTTRSPFLILPIGLQVAFPLSGSTTIIQSISMSSTTTHSFLYRIWVV